MNNQMILTNEQIEKLNDHQNDDRFHPYTCPNDGDQTHIKYEFEKTHPNENYEKYLKKEKEKGIPYPEMEFTETKLIATENGWFCPVCNYTQPYRDELYM